MQLRHGSMRRGSAWAAIVGAVALATGAASAATIYVPDDYPTIQLAINACVDGDEVVVFDGTYTGSANRNLDFGGRLITVRSASGDPSACTIDCELQGRGFVFTSGETAAAIVDGFTIANGFAPDYGGGIFVDRASPTFRNCVIRDCFADIHGGGASIDGGLVSFTDCTFRNNLVFNDGGAIYAYEGGASPISDCVFEYNQAYGRGGALFNYVDWDVVIERTTFTGNTAGGAGGAIYHDADMITLDECAFTSNVAGADGGAVHVAGAVLDATDTSFDLNEATGRGGAIAADPAILTLTVCSFDRNDAASDASGGGAIYQDAGSMVLTACEFDANTAVRLGGAVHARGVEAELTACSFVGNSTSQWEYPGDEGGGAVANDGEGILTLRGCIFAENTTVGVGGALLNAGIIADLRGCIFDANTAEESGGAVASANRDDHDIVIRECRFEDNVSEVGGGAIYEGRGSVTDSLFIGNAAYGGGAVTAFYGRFDLVNCRFLGNRAEPTVGGAIFVSLASGWTIVNCEFGANVATRGGAIPSWGNTHIANCTFWGNSEYAVYGRATDEVTNCIIWNSEPAPFDPDELPIVTYCDVEGGHPGTGNIDIDPLFVDPVGPDGMAGTEDDDLRLICRSPCIDAASNALVPADTADIDEDGNVMEQVPLDLDRNPRFVDHPLIDDSGQGSPPIVDMGPYEFQASPCPADLNGSGAVEIGDILILLQSWGDCRGCPEDLDCDDAVAFSDILMVLATWGPCP